MPEVDPAFAAVPHNAPAFLIWRVESMKVCPLPAEEYGRFFRGDSYIVYSASEQGGRPGRGPLEVHIHFWLGSQTSSDEAGVAAYKTVELDDLLGGAPVQHREVEGRESQRFRGYFREGLVFLEGGVASGMTHVGDTFEPRMYMVKGKRSPVVRQLPSVAWRHVNDGDVFVVDARDFVFVWTGRAANNMEKIQGARLAQRLKAAHGGGEVVVVESGAETGLAPDEQRRFDELLAPGERCVAPAEPDAADETQERRLAEQLRLYRCSDAGGTLQVTEVKHGPLFQEDLVSDDSFIVDNGDQGIWVWVGKRASAKERSEGMRNAQGFVQKKGYPSHTPVTRVIDGGEPPEFRSLFRQWRERGTSVGLGRQFSAGSVAKVAQNRFDAAMLHNNRALAARTQMVDDGSGQKQVWRVENFDLAEVPESGHGKFYGGDCYVVQYTYRVSGRDHWIIYYWLGAYSSQDERGTAALKAVELDDKLGGRPVQVRVVQGKEPPHFMAMFSGRLVIYAGGKASAFDGPAAEDHLLGDTYLLHVRGTQSLNTKAVQVECRARSLNSNDCFVLRAPEGVTVWCGKGATAEEREVAAAVGQEVSAACVTIVEGEEPDAFWSTLGGREEYATGPRLAEERAQPARLFQCSNASGAFRVTEVADFDQSDLCEDDVMLLDAWDAVFVWVGSKSNRDERQQAEQAAIEYLRTDPAGRGTGTPILRTRQHSEPPSFTGFFGVWNSTYWAEQPSWAAVQKEVREANRPVLLEEVTERREGPRYPLEVLKEKELAALPDDVDPTRKEEYLAPEEFTKVFGISWAEFQRMPQWKRVQKKKAVGLF
ncbi:advillin-like [Pollicipes pollicipes]|uniref:advillin-like n=1 Tax=Pollicipes pollicipes TaxID=41117 RepID=UPI001884C21D|nr:advillin-like [Pollicipes pollicipes]